MIGRIFHLLEYPSSYNLFIEKYREQKNLVENLSSIVPITASGRQGEKPLVDKTM